MNSLINDFHTLEIFKNADTDFVSNFKDKISKELLLKIKPNSLNELCAIFSLNRPQIESNLHIYISNRKNINGIKYIHPIIEKNLQETFGVFVYAEQIEN